MAKIDMWLDETDIADGLASGRFLFEPPSDAVRRGDINDPNDDKAKASWVQRLEIVESKMYEDSTKDREGHEYPAITVEVKFQVPAESLRPSGEPDKNAGRYLTAWYRIVPAAMKNKQHPKFKANNFSHGKAMQILRSIWGSQTFPQGQKVNLGDFFSADTGVNPPVVGKMVVANILQSKYEGKPRDEISDFVPLELAT
jgi:hypothetical protein